MARYSEQAIFQDIASSAGDEKITASVWEGMAAAAEGALRVSVGSSIARGFKSLTDTSEPIDYNKANEEFGLEGEAAFTENDKPTRDMAAARADDQSKLARLNLIQGMASAESPILGGVTQLAAAIGASFVDPAMLAVNIGGTMAIAKGVGALVKSSMVMNKVLKTSPELGKMLMQAYNTTSQTSLLTHVAREGAENFAGAAIEETINLVGVGSDRMARKVGVDESVFNVLTSTFLGATLGTVIGRESRGALSRSVKKRWGDDAAAVLDSSSKISTMESNLGIQSNFETKIHEKDSFDPKPWFEEKVDVPVDNVEAVRGSKFYMALDEEGAAHTVSYRGDGNVLTNNINHAQNKGVKVIEIDPSDLNVATPKVYAENPKLKSQVNNNLVSSVVADATDEQLMKAAQHRLGMEIDVADIPAYRQELEIELKTELAELKSIDEAVGHIDQFAMIMGKDSDMHARVDSTLTEFGYDGYTYNQMRSDGSLGHTGLYVKNDASVKLKKTKEMEVPTPDDFQKAKYAQEKEMMMDSYVNHLDEERIRMELDKNAEMVGKKKIQVDEAAEEFEIDYDSVTSIITTNAEKVKSARANLAELQNKIDSGKRLTSTEKDTYNALDIALNKKDVDQLSIDQTKSIVDYHNCLKGN